MKNTIANHTDIDRVEADAWNLAGLTRALMLLAEKIQSDNQRVELNEDTAALDALAVVIRDRANRLASDINGFAADPEAGSVRGGRPMSRLAPQRDMSADEVIRCSYDAMALVDLCEHVADGLSELGVRRPDLLGAIGTALNLAAELMGAVHDCLEMHEGPPGNAQRAAGARREPPVEKQGPSQDTGEPHPGAIFARHDAPLF